jgi:hypothetical protein
LHHGLEIEELAVCNFGFVFVTGVPEVEDDHWLSDVRALHGYIGLKEMKKGAAKHELEEQAAAAPRSS